MTHIALFHSVLGVRPGIDDAAQRLRAAGHDVLVVDQYQGKVFEDYKPAGDFAASIGYPELMARAVVAVEDLSDGFVAMGFSNGGGMAEYVATQRQVAGVVMLSGALPLAMIDVESWPAAVPAQIHYTVGDPFRQPGAAEAVAASVRAAGGAVEVFDYLGEGHLFTDASLPGEHQSEQASLLWQRVLAFAPLARGGA